MLKKNKKNKLNYGVHEGLIVGIFLSIVGGILDAHTFLFRHGIFANTQTGNIVFLALSIVNYDFKKTVRCLISLVAFIVGIFLSEILKNFYRNSILKFVNTILSLEILLLASLSFIPKNSFDIVVIVVISFVCSLQTNSFRSLKGSPYASTMCTGNLRIASSNFLNFIAFKKKKQGYISLHFFIILASFFIGVMVGKVITELIDEFTLLFCSNILLVTMVFVNIKNLRKL